MGPTEFLEKPFAGVEQPRQAQGRVDLFLARRLQKGLEGIEKPGALVVLAAAELLQQREEAGQGRWVQPAEKRREEGFFGGSGGAAAPPAGAVSPAPFRCAAVLLGEHLCQLGHLLHALWRGEQGVELFFKIGHGGPPPFSSGLSRSVT